MLTLKGQMKNIFLLPICNILHKNTEWKYSPGISYLKSKQPLNALMEQIKEVRKKSIERLVGTSRCEDKKKKKTKKNKLSNQH